MSRLDLVLLEAVNQVVLIDNIGERRPGLQENIQAMKGVPLVYDLKYYPSPLLLADCCGVSRYNLQPCSVAISAGPGCGHFEMFKWF